MDRRSSTFPQAPHQSPSSDPAALFDLKPLSVLQRWSHTESGLAATFLRCWIFLNSEGQSNWVDKPSWLRCLGKLQGSTCGISPEAGSKNGCLSMSFFPDGQGSFCQFCPYRLLLRCAHLDPGRCRKPLEKLTLFV